MAPQMTPLDPDDRFRFNCSAQVACFNQCCRDLNQFLTPYDILRLKQGLELPSDRFLERYTRQHIGPESGLPIITLKPADPTEPTCPFVTPAGCRVYADRPSSCRTYPLMRVVSRSRETGRLKEQYMLLKESHCLGFAAHKSQTVHEWVLDQGLSRYHEMNDQLMVIISLKNQRMPAQLTLAERHLFHRALYDLDRFRKQVFEQRLPDDFSPDADKLTAAETDDAALLEIGFQWIKQRWSQR